MAVVFNGTERLIEVTDPADLSLDVEKDIYSRWKDWVQADPVNAGYAPAFTIATVFGGNPTVAGQTAPKYFILTNYWVVYINNGEVVSIGLNLYSTDFPTPYIIASGSGVIDLNSDSPVVITNGGGGGTGEADWTVIEKKQIRDALGIDGDKRVARGGQLQKKGEAPFNSTIDTINVDPNDSNNN